MSDATNQALAEAYTLIEADRDEEAVALLKPILERDQENVDAWWLYAYAVEDPETARMALNQVLKYDPDYPGASDLLNTLESQYPVGVQRPSQAHRTAPPPHLPDDVDLAEFDPSEIDAGEDISFEGTPTGQGQPQTSNRRSIAIIASVLIVLIALVFIVFALLNNNQPVADLDITLTDITEQQAELTGGSEALVEPEVAESVSESLQDYEIAEDGVVYEDTSLGRTLLVDVCTTAGQGLREAVAAALFDLAPASQTLPEDVDAIGVRFRDCTTEETLRIIGVSSATAQLYAENTLDARQFEAQWRAVG